MGSATWTRTRNPPEPELLTPEQLEHLGPGPLRPGWARFHSAPPGWRLIVFFSDAKTFLQGRAPSVADGPTLTRNTS